MYFPLKFGDFQKLLQQKFSDDSLSLDTFYFETGMDIYLFKIIQATCFYSIIFKSEDMDVVKFKQEHLAQAKELPDLPLELKGFNGSISIQR